MDSSVESNARQYKRQRTFTIGVLIDGTDYEVQDISINGVLLSSGPDWMAEGQGISFYFVVDVEGENSYIAANGTVVRNSDRKLAIQYEAPHPKWDQILPAHLARHG